MIAEHLRNTEDCSPSNPIDTSRIKGVAITKGSQNLTNLLSTSRFVFAKFSDGITMEISSLFFFYNSTKTLDSPVFVPSCCFAKFSFHHSFLFHPLQAHEHLSSTYAN